jgi:predicted nucleic acid-binding protein
MGEPYLDTNIIILPRSEIVALLRPLLRLRGFRVRHREVVLHALDTYALHALDFTDAVIVAAMQHSKSTIVYSFDQDFDRFEGIAQREP